MKFYEFKDWYKGIKDNDFEYIRNLKYYGFRIIFNEKSTFFKENNIWPDYPWKKNYKRLWFKNELNVEKWLFSKNKRLYYKWKRQTI